MHTWRGLLAAAGALIVAAGLFALSRLLQEESVGRGVVMMAVVIAGAVGSFIAFITICQAIAPMRPETRESEQPNAPMATPPQRRRAA